LALDEPRNNDTRTVSEGFDFLLSPRDAQMLEPGRSLRIDYTDGIWGGGFYVTASWAKSCA